MAILAAVAGSVAGRVQSAQRNDTTSYLPGDAESSQVIDVIKRASGGAEDWVIVPLLLAVVMLVLGLLLRSIVAPVLLVGTVIFSYAAALGAGAFAFRHLLHYAGEDPSLILFSFLFLVALGCDYNIVLMTRAREEAAATGDTRQGMLRALSVTGAVISSAGIEVSQ